MMRKVHYIFAFKSTKNNDVLVQFGDAMKLFIQEKIYTSPPTVQELKQQLGNFEKESINIHDRPKYNYGDFEDEAYLSLAL